MSLPEPPRFALSSLFPRKTVSIFLSRSRLAVLRFFFFLLATISRTSVFELHLVFGPPLLLPSVKFSPGLDAGLVVGPFPPSYFFYLTPLPTLQRVFVRTSRSAVCARPFTLRCAPQLRIRVFKFLVRCGLVALSFPTSFPPALNAFFGFLQTFVPVALPSLF